MSVSKRRWNSVDHLDQKSEQGFISVKDRLQIGDNLVSLKSRSEINMLTASLKDDDDDGEMSSEDSDRDSDVVIAPTKSVSRQKKFSRHFKIDDNVLDYYSCALAVDILLQGFIYITNHHFAFHSNVFGRLTQVVIPVCTIEKITKNNFLIFPNAIHVHTSTGEKHAFASLLSRDTAYSLMHRVWSQCKLKSKKSTKRTKKGHHQKQKSEHKRIAKTNPIKGSLNEDHIQTIDENAEGNQNESSSDSASGQEQPPSSTTRVSTTTTTTAPPSPGSEVTSNENVSSVKPLFTAQSTGSNSRTGVGIANQKRIITKTDKIVIIICFLSIIILTLSAANLYHRIDYMMEDNDLFSLHKKIQNAENEQLYIFQKFMHGNSANDFVQRVDDNIQRIRKVSESLEACKIGQRNVDGIVP